MLTEQQILNTYLKTKIIHIDEWDADVTMRQLSLWELDEHINFCDECGNRALQLTSLIVRSLHNEDGSRVFPDTNKDIVILAKNLDGKLIEKLYDIVYEFNQGFDYPLFDVTISIEDE